MKGHVAAVDRQESRVWKESRDLKERKEKSWIVQCHRPTGNSVCGKEIIIKTVVRSKKGNIKKIFIPYIIITKKILLH